MNKWFIISYVKSKIITQRILCWNVKIPMAHEHLKARDDPRLLPLSRSFQAIPTDIMAFTIKAHYIIWIQASEGALPSDPFELVSHHFLLFKTRFPKHYKAFFLPIIIIIIIIIIMIVFGHGRSSTACVSQLLNSVTCIYTKKEKEKNTPLPGRCQLCHLHILLMFPEREERK